MNGDTMVIRGDARPLNAVPSMTLYAKLAQARVTPDHRAAIGRELARRAAGGVVAPWPVRGRRGASRTVRTGPARDALWRQLLTAPPCTLAVVLTPCGARGRALLLPIAFGFWQIRVHWDSSARCGETCRRDAVESAHAAIAAAAAQQLEVSLHRLADVVVNPAVRRYREVGR